MTRAVFHRELDELKEAVVQTTRLVESALGHAMQALLQRDVTLALRVIEGDAVVNEQQQRLSSRTFDVIARQAPVAGDLRQVMTFQLVITELERIGDLAVGIAHQALGLTSQASLQAVGELPDMARLVRQQLLDASQVFLAGSVADARQICARDDAVDLLYHRVFEHLLTLMQEAASVPQATSLLFVAHDLERIGDRVTNICEDLIYMITGEREHLNQGSGRLVLPKGEAAMMSLTDADL
jgi:phosphate transport system protein